MSPEEYQRLKEAEKEHLRSLRKLKQAVKTLERQKKLTDAVEGATSKPLQALGDHDALVEELAMETARNEAKLEFALESISQESPEEIAINEEELRKARAANLVRQLKGQMGDAEQPAPAAEAVPAPEQTAQGKPEAAPKKDPHAPLPEKTIGRMKP